MVYAERGCMGNETGKTIGKNIGIICRQLNVFLNRELEEYGITASEAMYLGTLFLQDGIIQDKLAEEFCVDKAAVARAISTLEGKGLVERRCSRKDKRSKQVFLTAKALAYKDILSSIQEKWFCEVISSFEKDEIKDFSLMLEKISLSTRELNEKKEL